MKDYSALAKELQRVFPGMDLREMEPMDRHTTFRVGGRVSLFCRPGDEEETVSLCARLRSAGVRPFIMGRGSNLLFADGILPGVVVQMADNQSGMERTDDRVLYAQAGAALARLAQFAKEEGLSGLEFAGGIPGAVGGAVTMNAGAYGGEMKDVVTRVDYLDQDLERRFLSGEDCAFRYRGSLFSQPGNLILGVQMALYPERPEVIEERMETFRQKRAASQPLDRLNAGSTFKRPENGFAAQMIDEAGLKGFSIGGAQVSEKHAGFVVNRGDATCRDVLELMEYIQKTVQERTGVLLEPEVRIVERLEG